jgi:MFS transporter, AAHS family, benzoate transport protein
MLATERRSLGPIVSFIAGNLLFGTGLIFHAFLYNFYLDALHLSSSVMGYAAAALAGGGLVTLLPAGAFTDRAGPRGAVTTAAVVLALGLALGAIATTPSAVYAAAAAAGAGSGMWRVATPPILMALSESGNRTRAFAWNVGLLVVWGGLGTALAGAMSQWLGTRSTLLFGAALSAASLALFRKLPVAEQPAPRVLPVSPTRELLLLVGLVAAWMLAAAVVAPFFNIFFARRHHVSIEQIGFIFAVANVCWALAVIGSGELARRVGGTRVLGSSLLLFAPALWGLSVAGTVGLAIALYLFQGLIGPVTNPLIDQWLLGQTPPERHGTVSSWRQVAADGSAMIGAGLGGRLLEGGGFERLFVVAGAIGLVGALGLIAGARRRAGG